MLPQVRVQEELIRLFFHEIVSMLILAHQKSQKQLLKIFEVLPSYFPFKKWAQ